MADAGHTGPPPPEAAAASPLSHLERAQGTP